ncbi:MAG: hypothetical protein PF518_09745 [Spirochaetaceae bacterium]|jgi:ABC-type transporter Mla maintaining outer membrane lipid asymmetry ATPase subunit MlaF|nr:hypothetical protein [Spirochaetaceae bacterium]
MKEANVFLGGEIVLDSVNLEIMPGTTTVILGLSGSGNLHY